MKCVIALAILAVALPAAFGAPRPGVLAGATLLKSADLLDGAVISAPAAYAVAPASISSHSTVIAHPSPAIAYAHHAPLAYSHHAPLAYSHHAPLAYSHHAPLAYSHHAPLALAHSAPLAVAHSVPVVAAAPSLLPAGKTTVIAGPSGTITETQGLGAVASW